jgi:O-antigen/teichoic acid export membrane protein
MKYIIIARFLSPEQFGLFGFTMLAVIIIETFSYTGLNSALIQHKENPYKYLNTVWTIQVIRGLLLALILFLVAPMISWFFEESRLEILLRVMCFAFLIQGFINIGIIYFEKEFEFHKQFLYEMISSVGAFLIGIMLAYKLKSVWALIWSNLVFAFIRFVLSYMLSAYRPHFQFLKSRADEMFQFGRWVTGHAIVRFCSQQVDKIILGKLLGPSMLGFYQIAQRISDQPLSNIINASVSFTFPAYAKIQQNKDRLRTAFLDVFEILISLVLPLVLFTMFATSDIVYGLLGEKWKDAIVPIKLISFASFLMAFDVISTPLFMGVGAPNIEFWKQLIKAIILLISIFPLTMLWGIYGTCISLILSALAALPFWLKVISIIDASWKDIFTRLSSSFAIGFSTLIAIGLTHMLISQRGILSLIITGIISLLFFSFVAFGLGKIYKKGIYIHLLRILKKI